MSRRRDGYACWLTSAAYGAIAADWGAGLAGVTAAGDLNRGYALGAGEAAVVQ